MQVMTTRYGAITDRSGGGLQRSHSDPSLCRLLRELSCCGSNESPRPRVHFNQKVKAISYGQAAQDQLVRLVGIRPVGKSSIHRVKQAKVGAEGRFNMDYVLACARLRDPDWTGRMSLHKEIMTYKESAEFLGEETLRNTQINSGRSQPEPFDRPESTEPPSLVELERASVERERLSQSQEVSEPYLNQPRS